MNWLEQANSEIEWYPVDAKFGPYEFNIKGQLRRTVREKGFRVGRLRAMQFGGNGYPCHVLSCPDRKMRILYVHRMLATRFIPNPLGLPEVNHKDGDMHNFSLDNLEWVTSKQNKWHKIHVLKRCLGEDSSQAVLKERDVIEIRRRSASGEFQENIANDFGVTQTAISSIVTRKTWKHVA